MRISDRVDQHRAEVLPLLRIEPVIFNLEPVSFGVWKRGLGLVARDDGSGWRVLGGRRQWHDRGSQEPGKAESQWSTQRAKVAKG
ncbi:hypothetical protein GCM10007908_34590 [Rhizobium albus]|nr:hypothetical protein GCM10007908_34590 [Rhizobium albus]